MLKHDIDLTHTTDRRAVVEGVDTLEVGSSPLLKKGLSGVGVEGNILMLRDIDVYIVYRRQRAWVERARAGDQYRPPIARVRL